MALIALLVSTAIAAGDCGGGRMVCSGIPAEMNVALFRNGSFELGARPVPVPGPNQLLLRVEAAALNRIDAMMARGKLGEVDVVGLDVAGVVVALGPGCGGGGDGGGDGEAVALDRIGVGSRVMALLMQGGYAGYALVHELDAMPVPASLSLAEAAGVPEAWLTAFQLLHAVGDAKPGQRLLLHAAGSGVGTAALQLAVAHGLRVAAVAGAARKLVLAAELGAELALDRKEVLAAGLAPAGALARALAPSFAPERGGHIDLVLDCVGGGDVYAAAHAEVLATDGVWVLFGLLGGAVPGPPGHALFGALMRKRLQLRATTLRSRSPAYKRALQRRLAEEVLPFFRGGGLPPRRRPPLRQGGVQKKEEEREEMGHLLGVTGAEEKQEHWLEEEREAAFRAACPGGVRPRGATPCFRVRLDSVFPLREAQAAHARMLANGNLGKIVLDAMHEGRPGLSCACEAPAAAAAPPAGGEGQQQQSAPEAAGGEGGGDGALGDVNNAVFD